jgi:hypothetical protein
VAEIVPGRSTLDPARLRPRGVGLGERLGLGKIDLRGNSQDRAFMAAVGRVFDLLLPGEPRRPGSRSRRSGSAPTNGW